MVTPKPSAASPAGRAARALAAVSISKWVLIGVPVALVIWLVAGAARLPALAELSHTADRALGRRVFTLDNFRTAYFSAETFRLFFNSVQFAAGTAVFALGLGTALAWMNERTNTPFKRLFFALSIIPLVIPGNPVHGVVDHAGAARRSAFSTLMLQRLFGTDAVFINIYTMTGMIWVDGLHYSPMAFLLMTAAFRSIGPGARGVAR